MRNTIEIVFLFFIFFDLAAQDSLTIKSAAHIIQVKPENEIVSFVDGEESIIKVMTTGSFYGYHAELKVESSDSKIIMGNWDNTSELRYRFFKVLPKRGSSKESGILKLGIYINEPSKYLYIPSKIDEGEPLFGKDSKVIYSNATWQKTELTNYYLGEMEFVIRKL